MAKKKRSFSLGALIAVGLGAWFVGLGMGGRTVARAYERQYGPFPDALPPPLPPGR